MPATRKPRDADGPREVWAREPTHVEAGLAALANIPHVGRATELFALLANANRFRAVVALSATEMCIVDLAAMLNLTSWGAKDVTDDLRAMNLVKWREGLFGLRFYSLRNPNLAREAVKLVAETLG